jgi:hypothetical protein
MSHSSIPGDPFLRAGFDHSAHVVGAVRLENVARRGIDWLWPGRIPIGKVTLLVGDQGLGKSLVTLDLAARVSTGAPWPDEERVARSDDGEKPALEALAPRSFFSLAAELRG